MWHDQDVAGRDAIWQRRWGVAPSFTIGLGTDTRLTASYYHLTSHELPDSGIPYLYTIGNAPGTGNIYTTPALGDITTIGGTKGNVDRSTYYGLVDRDFRDATTDQATIRVEHDFGGLTLRNTSRFTAQLSGLYLPACPTTATATSIGTSATPPATGSAAATRGDIVTGGYLWRRANTRYGYSQSMVNQTDLFGTFNTGSIKHNISIGAELSLEKARRGAFVTRGYLNATSGVEQLSTGSTISSALQHRDRVALLLHQHLQPEPERSLGQLCERHVDVPPRRFRRCSRSRRRRTTPRPRASTASTRSPCVPSLILNLGARYDRFTSELTPGQAGTATRTVKLEQVDNLFNWQAGLVFKPTPDTSLYASYATCGDAAEQPAR